MDSKISLTHKGKVVVLTGCNGQIGRELSKRYIELGAIVVGIDLSEESHLDLTHEKFMYYCVDIRRALEVEQWFESVIQRFGSIDILINNAGVATFNHYLDRTQEQIDLMMDVNLKGTFNCMRAFIENLSIPSLGRSIVNIGSIYGAVSPDFRIYSEGDRRSPEMYGATKAGVIQMTRYFAVDLARKDVRVNSISPGGIFNPESPQNSEFVRKYAERTPMGRMGTETEIASAAIFLTSDLASYITGHNLLVDGGYSSL